MNVANVPLNNREDDSSDALQEGSRSDRVRLESSPDACLAEISSPKDVFDKIEEVRCFQSQTRNAELYAREWVDVQVASKQSESVNVDKLDNSPVHTFTVLQFNTLAEGLSSGPTIDPPFQPICNLKNDGRNAIYGGFDRIPQPEIS